MGQQECPNRGESVSLNSSDRAVHNPDLLYEIRRLSVLVEALQSEIQNPKNRPAWMTTQEAADYARLSTKQIRRAVKSGRMKCANRSGHWRFKREWIDKYLINN